MNIIQSVSKQLKNIQPGKIFSVKDINNYLEHSDIVIDYINQNIENLGLVKVNSLLYYKVELGQFGPMSPTNEEIVKYFTTYKDEIVGYITGPMLFYRWGLSTQIPAELNVATSKKYYEKAFISGLRIETEPARYKVTNNNFQLLQLLDVLEDVDRILDTNEEEVILRLVVRIKNLSSEEILEIENMVIEAYPGRTIALLGFLLVTYRDYYSESLKSALNEASKYFLYCSRNWVNAEQNWNLVSKE